ncbi:PAS domain-containing hybrid sensor histidine kinase/response regulator [Siphonobacter curvatus]|uniref:histidine kinase n=1 Tax=Siphonobacter curvatus TaxID=2094562 RepID=A0A2S7IK15_9BACT|nr:PAS domain S-box protein [Siphonobacter curvatus]PQA56905.1 hypothetical protein C5O19_16345 [Siphonobacter curvatus]
MNTSNLPHSTHLPGAEECQILLASLAQTFWETDVQGNVLADSPSWRAYTGQTYKEWLQLGWTATVHPDDRVEALRQWQEALPQQKPIDLEFRLQRPEGGWRWTNIRATPILNPDATVKKWLGFTIDLSSKKQAEEKLLEVHQTYQLRLEQQVSKRTQELAENRELLQATLDSTLEMIQVFKSVRNEAGEIIDFTWVLNNKASERHYGDVIGKSLLTLQPGVERIGIFDTFKWVCETGIPDQSERHYAYEQFHGWFYQSTVKVDDGVATTTTDMTARKKAELELSTTKEHLQTILDSSLYIIQAFEAVRDPDGKIIDFVWVMNNQLAIQQNGEVIGKSLLEISPGVRETGLFEKFIQVTETGVSINDEQYYDREQFKDWFHLTLVKMGDGFVMNTDNITQRKQAELENLRLKDEIAQRAESALRVNEERYRVLIQNLPDYAIFRIDANGIIVEWTEAAQQVQGFVTEEVLGQPIDLFYTPEERAAGHLQQELEEASQIGHTEKETQRIRKNGERFWVNEITVAIRNEQGQLQGFTKISRDITLRKQEEAVRQQLETRTRLAVEAAEMATWEWHLPTDQVYWNEQHYHLLGLEVRSGIEESGLFLSHIHPEDQEPITSQLNQTIKQRVPYDEQFRIVREDGQVRWMSGYGKVTPEHDGVPVQLSGVMFDITDRKAAEESLREAARRKDEFLAMLAHELRNPMSTIRNGLQVLSLTTTTDSNAQRILEMMNRQTDHLVRLVDDLLDVSRISQGKIELRKERVNLIELVKQAVDAANPLYQSKQRHLHVSLPVTPIFMEGDDTRLIQMVTNLLTNGVRYTLAEGQVWLSLEHQGQQAILQVRDNGIGLTREQQASIFDLFVQVDHSLARSQGGLGVGLTVVKRLVEMHGGRIDVQSPGLGQGSTFTIYLPTLEIQRTKEITPHTHEAVTQYRILIVDDNPDACLTLRMYLELKGYEVHTENSGHAGIKAAERVRPDAILLDIGMPGLDGYETCRLIRQQSWGESILLIALTGYGQFEDKQRTLEAGFDEHLVKPVKLELLMQLMEDWMKRKQS